MAPQGEPPAEHHQPSTPSGGENSGATPARPSAAGVHPRGWWWLALVGVPFTLAALGSALDAPTPTDVRAQSVPTPSSAPFVKPQAINTPQPAHTPRPATHSTPRTARPAGATKPSAAPSTSTHALPAPAPRPRFVRVDDVKVSAPLPVPPPAPTPRHPRRHHSHPVWVHRIIDGHGKSRVIVWFPPMTCDNSGHHAHHAHHRVQPPTMR